MGSTLFLMSSSSRMCFNEYFPPSGGRCALCVDFLLWKFWSDRFCSIGKEAESEKNEGNQLLASLVELSKSQHEMYYGEKPETEQRRASESVQKQGYLRIRLYGLSLFNTFLCSLQS